MLQACQGVELINAGFPRGGPSKVYFNLIAGIVSLFFNCGCSSLFHLVCAAVIGAYMVLVPLVLLQAQGVPVKE